MSDSLDDILEGKATEVVEEPVVEAAETEEVAEAEEVTETEDTPEEVVEAEVVTAEPTAAKEDRQVPLAAVLDERDKRQAAEKRAADLEAEIEAAKEKPDFWADPEKALDSVRTELREEFQQKFTNGMLSYSMQSASYRHDDFNAMKDSFTKAVEDNPALAQQAVQSEDPGEYIYNTGKQFAQLNAVGGDISALEQRIRNEIRAEFEAKGQDKANKLALVPDALTNETSAAAPREKVEGGIEPLSSIFKTNSG